MYGGKCLFLRSANDGNVDSQSQNGIVVRFNICVNLIGINEKFSPSSSFSCLLGSFSKRDRSFVQPTTWQSSNPYYSSSEELASKFFNFQWMLTFDYF